jgi:CRP-like cAMP-binding protein
MEPLIQYLSLFTHIPEEDQAIISEHITLRNVHAGEVLIPSGSVARQLFFITQGILKVFTLNEKGNEVTHFFLKENQFCTILNSLTNNVSAEEGIAAACDASLIVFHKQELLQLYERLPYLKELFGSIMHQALMDKIQTRNAYMGEDASTRYKKFISRQPEIALRVPLSDVASYLGITPQSLSRIRRKFTNW